MIFPLFVLIAFFGFWISCFICFLIFIEAKKFLKRYDKKLKKVDKNE
jgi:uncharacterized membrane protein YciS (DUF1049 family)